MQGGPPRARSLPFIVLTGTGKHRHGVHTGTSSFTSSDPPKASFIFSSCAAAWLSFFLLVSRGGVCVSPLSARAHVRMLGCILARRAGGARCCFSTLLITAVNGNGAVLEPHGLCRVADALPVPIVPRRGAERVWGGGQQPDGPDLSQAVTACLLLSRRAAVPAWLCHRGLWPGCWQETLGYGYGNGSELAASLPSPAERRWRPPNRDSPKRGSRATGAAVSSPLARRRERPMHPSLSSPSGGPSWSLTTPELLPGSEKVAGSPKRWHGGCAIPWQ